MNSINFVCTSLVGKNKVGVIKPDANGYYRMRVGALNMFNSAGMWYPFEAARSIFVDMSGEFQRRVKRGVLGGENGHPKFLPGMTEAMYFSRLLQIYEENTCCHHAEIILDFDNAYDDQGNKIIGIDSMVCPSGPLGDMLRQELENPKKNVCFSIRSFTDDRLVNGIVHRNIKKVVTFDKVTEPGMHVAEKFKSAALEGLVDANGRPLTADNALVDVEGKRFTRGTVEEALRASNGNPGLESIAMDTQSLMASFGWDPKVTAEINRRATRAAWNAW